jgi:hypothetical protein
MEDLIFPVKPVAADFWAMMLKYLRFLPHHHI